MFKRFAQTLALCAISLVIYASSNHSADQLFNFASYPSIKPSQHPILLFKASALKHQNAKQSLLEFARTSPSTYWLKQLTTLNSSEAAYSLATRATNLGEQRYWFRFAAKLGDAKSQFELSLVTDKKEEQASLLEASATQNYQPAVITLAKFYYESLRSVDISTRPLVEDVENAVVWLEKAARFDQLSAFKLAHIYWRLGNKSESIQKFESAQQLGNSKAPAYLAALNEQAVQPVEHMFTDALASQSAGACQQTLQFVASNLSSVVQARAFKQRFEADDRLKGLGICVNNVAWLSTTDLKCSVPTDTSRGGRVSCDLSAIARVQKSPQFTHLVVFARSGRAYVQHGAMYLDQGDEYSVFVHELAHFAGFVDEYTLSPALARQHCSVSKAPNIMLADTNGDFDVQKLGQWRSLNQRGSVQYRLESHSSKDETNFVVAKSKTCRNLQNNSYKPSADITFLEHHDTNNIPPLYRALWHQAIQNSTTKNAVAEAFMYSASSYPKAREHWQLMLEGAEIMPAPESVQSTLP